MSNGNRSYIWLLVLGAFLAGLWLHNCSSSPMTLVSAVHDGKVDVQIQASGDAGGSAVLTVSRSSGASGKIVVVIPSGTVFYSAGPGTQRLMTAVEVRVVLTDQTPQVNTTVQTYCLDEFALTPADTSSLSIDPPDGEAGFTTEETEPFHKLADCMANSSLSESDKQLAVWAVKGDLLSKSHDQALQFITDGLVDEMSREERDKLKAMKQQAAQLTRDLSSDQIDAAFETEFQNSLPGIRDRAASNASRQLASFMQDDREMLSTCGYSVADEPLFQ